MKHLYLFTLTLCLLSYTEAQSQNYYINLNSQVISIPNRQVYISQVIDARPLKTYIGLVQRGLTNSKTTASFKEGLEKELTSFLKSQLPEKEGMQPIIVKVLRLKISEHTGITSEKASVEVAVDFIHPREEGYYRVYRATAVAGGRGLDVTGQHDMNIATALKDCLEQLEKSNWESQLADMSPLSWEEVKSEEIAAAELANYPILKDERLTRGIYQDFMEFRNNAPNNTEAFELETWERTAKDWKGTFDVTPYQTNDAGKRKVVKNAWGFCDGVTTYIYFQKEYFPIEREGNVLTFYGFAPPDGGKVTAASIAGGAIGGAIGGTIAAAATSGRRKRFVLDILTGQVSEFVINSYEGRMVSNKPAKIILYYQKNKSQVPVNLVFKNSLDSIQTNLKPNSFIEIEWTATDSEVTVCPDGSEEECFTFLPHLNKVNYLEYVPQTSGTGKPFIKMPSSQEAKFYLKKIRYAQEAEEKRKGK